MRVCLVTDELPGFGASGGIGTAFHELSLALADHGHSVDILLINHRNAEEEFTRAYSAKNINILHVDVSKYAWIDQSPTGRSFAVYKHLLEADLVYDVVHFSEYSGLGFYTLQAQRLLTKFPNTRFVVQTHGPTRWALASNLSPLTHQDHILMDFMESRSLQGADVVVSPSQYLIDWMIEHDMMEAKRDYRIIPNLGTTLTAVHDPKNSKNIQITEVIMFGRHEFRKGLTTFCDAVDTLSEFLDDMSIAVTFLGQPGDISGTPSEIYLTNRSRKWQFVTKILSNYSRADTVAYLGSTPSALVVVPSTQENSPYTVLECVSRGIPVITSKNGGAKELIASSLHEQSLFDGSSADLAEKIRRAVLESVSPSKPAVSNRVVEKKWLKLHEELTSPSKSVKIAGKKKRPKAVLGITHYERPDKLMQAVYSAIDQTYENIEVVVVDDGSKSPAAIEMLARVERLLAPRGGRVIKRENGYLGAARNTIVRETDSDFVIFLDDDDIALPDMVETLVNAALRSPDAIIAPLHLTMEESRRGEALLSPANFEQKPSFLMTGGPLASVPFGNYLSAATALIPRVIFERLGGYSELKGVGFEDFELYVRALQAGVRVEVIPEALYLYEVDRPSMISATPPMANISRVLDVIDFSASPSAWKDAFACIAGPLAIENAVNRSLWLERLSPNNDVLSQIRIAPPNSADRLSALENYAKEIGADQMATAWSRANLRLDEKKSILPNFKYCPSPNSALAPLSHRSSRLTSAKNWLSKQPRIGKPAISPGPIITATVPYEIHGFGIAAGYEYMPGTKIDWITASDSCTLDARHLAGGSWLTLEFFLDADHLGSQRAIDYSIELSTSVPVSGGVVLRLVNPQGNLDAKELHFKLQKRDTLDFFFRMPPEWLPLLPNVDPRIIMFFPPQPMQITIHGASSTVAQRETGTALQAMLDA